MEPDGDNTFIDYTVVIDEGMDVLAKAIASTADMVLMSVGQAKRIRDTMIEQGFDEEAADRAAGCYLANWFAITFQAVSK